MSGMQHKRRVAVVTGTRAEFGLLEPVMRAVRDHPALELSVVVAGSHFLPPAETWREVEAKWGEHIGAEVPMQQSGHLGRFHDAVALGHGVLGMAHALDQISPDWVVVLGDRIEAFAAASAAAVAGVGLAHLHGGDRAEGVADESIRHAISKLAHLHLAATAQSAARLERMGEQPERIHVVGSPAIDALAGIPAADDAAWRDLGKPSVLLLFHPVGDPIDVERERAHQVAQALEGERVLWMHPNHDPGRDGVMLGIGDVAARAGWAAQSHLTRDRFVGILKRLAAESGVIVGNSSAALIEAAALRLPAIDIGERQGGREAPPSVVHVETAKSPGLRAALERSRSIDRATISHPYGDGKTAEATAHLLASVDPRERAFIRKRNAY
jgi:UDP-hydrolysing UDP-N-acetyl-D-glucosamine 2-epimerase